MAACISLVLMASCNQRKDSTQHAQNKPKQDTTGLVHAESSSSAVTPQETAEQWLKSIFKTKDSEKYFPDYNVEEKLCTKRYQDFIAESGELYGPSNLDDSQFLAAEKKYKAKWSGIYPISEQEMWLFGRGNGDIGELKALTISKVKDLVFRVVIDYGAGIKTENEVTLVAEDGTYKIDYCKTEFL